MSGEKPILCLDFDGVLHSYTSGWRGATCIPDPPVPGAQDFCRQMMERFTVVICSSRCNESAGRGAIRVWLDSNDFPDGIVIAREKPAAVVSIDDRALTFDGRWPTVEELSTFQPWYKQAVAAALHQPAPRRGREEVGRQVLADIQSRMSAGLQKYGCLLQTFNGRDALMDSYQESIDLVMYLRQAIMERESEGHSEKWTRVERLLNELYRAYFSGKGHTDELHDLMLAYDEWLG